MKLKTVSLLTLTCFLLSGCNSPKDFIKGRTNNSYYYDAWYGEVTSEIRYLGRDVIDVVEIGFESQSNAELWGFVLPENKLPILPDFLTVKIGEETFALNELSLEVAQKISGNSGHKRGYFEWGDSKVFYIMKGFNLIFYGDTLVYFRCTQDGAIFTNSNNGESGALPLSVGKMKKIFGEPNRIKKWSVL